MTEEKWLGGYSGQTTEELIRLQGEYRTDSIVLALEQALDGKAGRIGHDRLTAEENVVLAVESLEREVNNGGYDSLKRIGCADVAHLTQQAIDALGIEGQVTVEAIDSVMEGESDERNDKLGECDQRYYSVAGDLAGPLLEFVKQHADRIMVRG